MAIVGDSVGVWGCWTGPGARSEARPDVSNLASVRGRGNGEPLSELAVDTKHTAAYNGQHHIRIFKRKTP